MLYSIAIVVGVLILAGFIALHLKVRKMRRFPPIPENENSVVIITGCDSGIGRTTAGFLVEKGFHVICSVLTENGEKELQEERELLHRKGAKGEISVKIVDITSDQSVADFQIFVDTILSADPQKQIKVLVNNAGIALTGPLEVQPLAHFIRQVEVNLFGHVRVFQMFAPHLRQSSGRIINICSLAGRVAAETMGAYCASKYALEAVSDTLRLELTPWNVSVSSIEPGFMRTPLVCHFSQSEMIERAWDTYKKDARKTYKKVYDRNTAIAGRAWKNAADPIKVTRAIYHAISSSNPKTRYLVGIDAKLIGPIRAIVPDVYFDALCELLI